MIEQLRKKLTVFLSSVITMILATMSILLFYAVVQEYSNSTYASYSKDTNLLYSYLNQTNIIDMNILNEYNTKNLNIDILRNDKKVLSTEAFKESKAILQSASPYMQSEYWDDYYSTINKGDSHRRFYTVRYNHTDYWNSYSIINIGGTYYTIHTVYNNALISAYKIKMSILFLIVTVIAIILLSIVSYFFMKKILIPVNEAYQKQDLFIAVASHELKTPITILKGQIQ